MKKRIAILASGDGTNAENLVLRFTGHDAIEVACVMTNRPNAGVIDRMRPLGVTVEYHDRAQWANPVEITAHLRSLRVELVVLAGFLAIIRPPLLSAFDRRIVNIHPSLLPRHGGPGMYGMRVHEAVLAAGDQQSGITIHLVNEGVDAGEILAQHTCDVLADDTPITLANRVHRLEYKHYPLVIEQYLKQLD